MSQDSNYSYDDIYEMLREVHTSWSKEVMDAKGEISYSPGNLGEVEFTRNQLNEIWNIGFDDEALVNYYKALIEVLDEYGENTAGNDEEPATEYEEEFDYSNKPSYVTRRIISIVFSLLFFLGLSYILVFDQYSKPDISYEQEWFVTEKAGWLRWDAFIEKEELKDVEQKIYLKKGIQLKPIAEIGTWVQVETEDGQIGLVDFEILKGSRLVYVPTKAMLSKTVSGIITDTLASGTPAIITERKIVKGRFGDELHFKIKLEDGRIRWGKEYEFEYEIFDLLPEIEQSFMHTTNVKKAQHIIIGNTIEEIENHYGPALSYIKTEKAHQAYFRHLVIADTARLHYKEILINFQNDTATGIEYLNSGEKRNYDIFPLVSTFRDFEFNQLQKTVYYDDNALRFEGWETWKKNNWFNRVISWLVWFVLLILGFLLFFSIPRIIISPIVQLFMFNNNISQGLVIIYNSIIYLFVTYAYFIITINMMGQWFIPLIGSLLVFLIWTARHFKNLDYNRCPMCDTMYAAINRGSTHTGTSKSETWGTYDNYTGETIELTRTEKITTKHYDRREKKTTKTRDSYLDHRECRVCGFDWDVDREEVGESTEHY